MRRSVLAVVGLTIVSLVVAACSADDPTPTPTSRSTGPTPRSAVTPSPQPLATATPVPGQTPPSASPTDSGQPADSNGPADSDSVGSGTGTLGIEWSIEQVDEGGKPALALDSSGTPWIAYMTEENNGFVKAAQRTADGWQPSLIAEGYFYGPLDIAVGNDDVVHVAYHDHQSTAFNPSLGDAAIASLAGGEWTVQSVNDDGHDGWDNRITTDGAGRPHMSGIDPVDFGGQGVEYYGFGDDGRWTVEEVGSGPQTYQFGTSVAIGADGTPYVVYYSQGPDDLVIASRSGGAWSIDTIDGDGDTGLFAELAIDSSGRFHVSYVKHTGGSLGLVKYATRASAGDPWKISDVGTLDDIRIGMVGARNITSIAIGPGGEPWIAFGDLEELVVAGLDGENWKTQRVVERGDHPLGQLVSLAVDADGGLHIAYFEGASPGPRGTVMYAKGTPAS